MGYGGISRKFFFTRSFAPQGSEAKARASVLPWVPKKRIITGISALSIFLRAYHSSIEF